jgi:2-polyprenyl-6-hydroxyphenyl methylase/3-demethylubiquinone-9 3-methyltransferase
VKVAYTRTTAEEFAEENPERFDVVTCMEMLEHVPDPASVVKACAALTKPGGRVFFSTLNRNPKAYLFAILGAERLLKLVPNGTHDFNKFIRPAELANHMRAAGLEVDDLSGMTYNPLTKVYALDANDVSVNYLVAATKPL